MDNMAILGSVLLTKARSLGNERLLAYNERYMQVSALRNNPSAHPREVPLPVFRERRANEEKL
jgi:hypothetical protein